jgi:hypothetical protein
MHGNWPGFSAVSRVVHAGWQKVTGRDPRLASVVGMRLAALVFGLLVVGVFWRGLVRRGGLWAGSFAALWLMLHPLFLGHSTEARCYTLVLLVEVLVLGALVRVMKGGRARDWLVVQGGSAALIYLLPGTLYLVLCVQVAAVCVCLRSRAEMRAWLACGLMGVGVVLAIGLPSLVDRYLFVRDRYPFTEAFPGWWMQPWNLQAAGFSWPSFDVEGLPGAGATWGEWAGFLVGRGWKDFPLETTLGLVVVPMLVLRGAFGLWCRGKGDALALGGLPVLAAVLTVLHHVWITGYLALPWYFVFALPGMAVLLAAGLGLWAERPGRHWAAHVAAGVFLLLFVFCAWPDGRAARLGLWPSREARQVGYQQGREIWVTSREGKITRYEPVRGKRKGGDAER